MSRKSLLGFPAVAIVILAAALVPTVSAETPTLLHYFKFDGDFTSEVSSVVANPLRVDSATIDSGGISGSAAYFDGVDDLLLLEGQDILPAGAITFSFWERDSSVPYFDDIADGYFLCDAAANPLNNLFLRRAESTVLGETEPTISAVNGRVGNNHFSVYAPEELTTRVWHHHMVTLGASGVAYWWVDGQLDRVAPTGDSFTGLTEVNAGSGYEYAGLVLGNRLTLDRSYYGRMDEVQIYQGSAHGGMAQYLYNNPSATLDTYDAGTYPDPGAPDAPGVRPSNASVHHWKFDGNLNEDGGTAHGAAIGDATVGTDNGMLAGSGAVAFDGDDDAVTISSDVITTNKYSIALWSKDASGTEGYLFSDETNSNMLVRRSSGGGYGSWAGGDDVFNFLDPETEAAATYDEWHHVVLAVDGEWGNVRAYIDGELAYSVGSVNGGHVASRNITADWGDGNGFQELLGDLLYLGNRASDMNRDYEGLMDDLQIYNWNLSEEDATYLYEHPGLTLFDTPSDVPGDATGNGIVDEDDAAVVAQNWGATEQTAGPAVGDFNGDGNVNVLDAAILAANWTGSTSEATAVPEPASWILLLGATLVWTARRRRATC